MIDDEEQKVQRAKAFAWRAIGYAVWLGIVLALIIVGLMILAFLRISRNKQNLLREMESLLSTLPGA